MSGRIALSRVVEMLARDAADRASLPAFEPLPRAGLLVLIGDFLSPLDRVEAALARFAGIGLKGHLLQIVDPAEEDLPFDGRVRFAGVEERDEILVEPRREHSRRIRGPVPRTPRRACGARRPARLDLWLAPHRPRARGGAARALCGAVGRSAAIRDRRL